MSYSKEEDPEVAIAFREALEDLQRNDQYAIDNLTVIAKESTEHAQALCRELETHIKNTRPEFKLPALYLLDSLVKHIGTPYTVYLSHNLYSTFFDAFTVVDEKTRGAMDELFCSWKKPVPESRDSRPVFPMEVTQRIDTSLIRYRNVAEKRRQEEEQARIQKMQRQMPSRYPPHLQQGRTPTPNGGYPYQPPQIVGQNSNPNPQDIAAMMKDFQQQSAPQYPPTAVQAPAALPPNRYGQAPPGYPQPPQNTTAMPYGYSASPAPSIMSHQARLDKLRADVQGLIDRARAHLARYPHDQEKTKLLGNLQNLKAVVDGGSLVLSQIQSTELVVANLARELPPLPPAAPLQQVPQFNPALIQSILAGSTPQPTPPQPYQQQGYAPPPVVSTPQYAPATPAPAAALPPNMAQIMSLLQTAQPSSANTTPQTQAATPAQPSLLDTLRAAGLLGATPVAPTVATPSYPPPQSQPQNPYQNVTPAGNDVRLDSASSLKMRRPYLIQKWFEDKSDQCRQCGMRFPATEAGKKAKSVHLDWHFKVNSRVTDSVKSAVNRSWYIDERDWVNFREELDGYLGVVADASGGKGSSKKAPKEHFVPVPTDVTKANQPCSICQEKFDVEWHTETEQPVWKDALKVGNKYYHASCYADVKKNNAAAAALMERGTSSTPDPVLGKRTFQDFNQDLKAEMSRP
ncbi:mRNA cleavage factor complex component Pcf11 [Venturia nashicola]|uniref:mRNA cleavage factor complex component Pcf11 n=1 Tax=Venturia nashicola TaxID=86259 RepID=A0A4Z1P1V4_9PEZI|nr:mRNA cleavage factor complex component Pcf11 [Venturia nashicola]TLD31977.1 mRNA cleavage factor complex component Pcf11 [Venturia nashicola]